MINLKTAFSMVLWVSIMLCSCHLKHKYTVVVTRLNTNELGEKEYVDKVETIMEQNDSMAYVNGSTTFLAHRLADILSGVDSNKSKPITFDVLNEQGAEISNVLDNTIFERIDSAFATSFEEKRIKMQERRVQLMKDIKN